MILLAIESSCDETAAALLEVAPHQELPTTLVLSDVVASQIEEHAPYGGVVPELASRRHLTAILPVIRRALAAAGRTLDDVEALAVTAGPGLVGSLLIGIQVAKAIAHAKHLPLVGVNHLAAHLLSSHLQRKAGPSPAPSFPYVGLVASGGHTALYAVWGMERFAQLATTRDDAAGEAFDKVGKLLGLPYPGGPAIDAAADGIEPGDLRFPRGLDRKDTLDFSFSGLKTAVADHLRARREPPDHDEVRRVAAAFQESVVASLVKKALLACQRLDIPRLTLGGGVAANGGLRRSMAEACRAAGVELFLPARSDCTDNAAMVGLAAVPRLRRGEEDGGSLGARSSWPIG